MILYVRKRILLSVDHCVSIKCLHSFRFHELFEYDISIGSPSSSTSEMLATTILHKKPVPSKPENHQKIESPDRKTKNSEHF